jgi:hypothetical protein
LALTPIVVEAYTVRVSPRGFAMGLVVFKDERSEEPLLNFKLVQQKLLGFASHKKRY